MDALRPTEACGFIPRGYKRSVCLSARMSKWPGLLLPSYCEIILNEDDKIQMKDDAEYITAGKVRKL